MRKLLATLALILATLLTSVPKAAADDGCSATVFLRDYKDGFRTNVEAFDFCFSRIKWWQLDQSDGWKGRYCHLGQYQYNGYQYFSMLFYHQDRKYVHAQYSESLFYAMSSDYSGRVGRGWPAQLEVHFSNNCGHY